MDHESQVQSELLHSQTGDAIKDGEKKFVTERLSAREASKKLLADERKELAKKIVKERMERRDKIAEMKVRVDILRISLASVEKNWGQNSNKYQELLAARAEQANSLAGRVKTMLGEIGVKFESDALLDRNIQEAEATVLNNEQQEGVLKAELSSLEKLLESDAALSSIKKQIAEHYTKAEKLSAEQFEAEQKSLKNTIARNDVFILHTLTTHPELRHNDNSPVSKQATLEDDLDIALSLEPSLSTSSVAPGKRKELFQEKFGNIGLIIGDGEVQFASDGDAGTVPAGINNRRTGFDVSHKDIDKVLQKKEGGYNEIVVKNAKIFGLFKSVDVKEDGTFFAKEPVDYFNKHINLASKRGIQQFVLTPDRRMFEYIGIESSGKIKIGKEISPVDVARGQAGLSVEERKKIGTDVISRNLFKQVSHHKEAEEIVARLSDENAPGASELSQEHEAQYGARYRLNNVSVTFEQRVSNPISGRLVGDAKVREKLLDALKHDNNFMIQEGGRDTEIYYLGQDKHSIVAAINELAAKFPDIAEAEKALDDRRAEDVARDNAIVAENWAKAQQMRMEDQAATDQP